MRYHGNLLTVLLEKALLLSYSYCSSYYDCSPGNYSLFSSLNFSERKKTSEDITGLWQRSILSIIIYFCKVVASFLVLVINFCLMLDATISRSVCVRECKNTFMLSLVNWAIKSLKQTLLHAQSSHTNRCIHIYTCTHGHNWMIFLPWVPLSWRQQSICDSSVVQMVGSGH